MTGALLSRADWLAVTILIVGTMFYMEWALARRFRRHERVEQSLYGQLALTAETAAGVAQVTARHLVELRSEVEQTKLKLQEMVDKLDAQERRLGAVEARYMRAALLYPPVSTAKEDP